MSTKKSMEKTGYRFVGRHSAIKICEWCRESLREKRFCYKQKFYGINSHRCIQMSPVVFNCTQNCAFCWRTLHYNLPDKNQKWDRPEQILEGCIEEQKKILMGFGGNRKTEKQKFLEALRPKHVAISLVGEPTLYPYLGEFIQKIHEKGMTSFLVTNGTLPEKLELLLKNKQEPTQLYITLAAPNEKVYKKTVRPLLKDSWKRLQKSLGLLSKFNRSVVRLTLVKGLNFLEPENYAEILEKSGPKFIECKSFMSIGGARERLPITSMPLHSQIKEFAKQISENSSYKILDEKQDSRVVLLGKDSKDRKLKFGS